MRQLIRRVVPPRLWAQLRLGRQRRIVSGYRRRVVRHTYGSFPLDICIADPVAAGWYDCDCPELPPFALMKGSRLRPGARVFNLGAHQCVVALMSAQIVGPQGSVIAVECQPHNVEIARQNRQLNGAANLHIVEAAVAAKPGFVTVNEGLNGQVDDGSGSWGRRRAPAITIDDLAREHGPPDVLVMDLEGYECQALRGARESLRSSPDCFIEVHAGNELEAFGGSVESVLSSLPGDAYRMWISPESHMPLTMYDASSDILRRRFFLTAVGT